MFIAALFPIAKNWKQPECLSVDEWIKLWCFRQGNTKPRKEGNPAICNNMGGP